MAKSSATLTIRNVPLRVVKNLKSLAKARHRSMEQEVRDLLEEFEKASTKENSPTSGGFFDKLKGLFEAK